MRKKYLYPLILLAGVCMFCFSCNGYLEEMPQNKLKPNTTDDYDQILNKAYVSKSVLPYLDVLTDDIALVEAHRIDWAANVADAYISAYMWLNSIETSMAGGDIAFQTLYNSIFNTNVVIGNIDEAKGVVLDEQAVETTRQNIKGEAHVLRAFYYFYLVNLYAPPYDPSTSGTTAGIPINLATDAADKTYTRATLKEVYTQIVDDIKEGIRLMEANPVEKNTKTKFNPLSAKALLARVYLYMQEWDAAIEQAKAVIGENPSLFDLRSFGEDPVVYTDKDLPRWNRTNIPGPGYLLTSNDNVLFVNGLNELLTIFDNNPFITNFSVSENLLACYEPGDVRKYYFMRYYTDAEKRKLMYLKNRYFRVALDQNTWEEIMSPDYGFTRVIRTEEMYLILAEAYAHKADGKGTAIGYLNTLRKVKFKDGEYTPLKAEDFPSEAKLLERIWKERRVELCFEEHRWFDLRRTTRPAMEHVGLKGQKAALKQNDPRYVLQIPQNELSVNPEIGANPR